MSPPALATVCYSLGPLYDAIAPWFPEHRTAKGQLDVRGLAASLEVTPEALYKSFRRNKISSQIAGALVKMSGGRGRLDTLHTFVFAA